MKDPDNLRIANIGYRTISGSGYSWDVIDTVTAPAPNSTSLSTTATWDFDVSSTDKSLTKVTMPTPASGVARPTIEFGYGAGGKYIAWVKDPEGHQWDYAYLSQDGDTYRLRRVTGPSVNGTRPYWEFYYSNELGSVIINGEALSKTEVRDPLYSASSPHKHRTVYLYTSSNAYPPMIRYVIDSQVTGDTLASDNDNVRALFPDCYYECTEWNTSDYTPASHTDRNGNTWLYEWDTAAGKWGNLLKVTDPNAKSTTMAYTPQNDIEEVTDPLLHKTHCDYYPSSYAVKYKYEDYGGLNLRTYYTYDSYGNLSAEQDPWNSTTTYAYDTRHRAYATTITSPTSFFVEKAYYSLGLPMYSRAPRSVTGDIVETDFAYDNLGRLTSTTLPDSKHSDLAYDKNGNVLSRTDERSRATTYTYDDYNRVLVETRPIGTGSQTTTTTNGYDAEGNRTSVTWKQGGTNRTIDFTYDERNYLTKTQQPIVSSSRITLTNHYDGNGNVDKRIDGRNQVTEYHYDSLSRLDMVDYDGDPSYEIGYGYNDDGLPSSVRDATGTATYTYDSAHRLLTHYQPLPQRTISYTYSTPPAQKRVTVDLKRSGTTEATWITDYRADGTVLQLTGPPNQSVTTYGYQTTNNLLSRVGLSNGTHTDYTYYDGSGERGWLKKVENRRSDDSMVSSFLYDAYDEVGNRLSIREENGHSYTYAYNRADELTSELKKDRSGATIYDHRYDYDEIGNRVSKNIISQGALFSYTYLADNKLGHATRTIGGASLTTNFTYDGNGNTQTRSDGGPQWSFTYDDDNYLTKLTRSGTTVFSFRYNAAGQRVERSGGAQGTIQFVYDGDNVVAETDQSGNLTALYTPGICEARKVNGSWVSHWYHCDGLGSVRQLTDNLQRVTDAYNFDAWGDEVGQIGASTNPHKFVGSKGYYSDDDSGLMLLGARYYDPAIGRFITQDPDRDGWNWYAYTGNDPVNETDPSGLSPDGPDLGYLNYQKEHNAVPAPSFGMSLIPIYGSVRQAQHDFTSGHPYSGAFNTVLAISDVFLVKSAAQAGLKVGWKGLLAKPGSRSWPATRKWLLRNGFAEPGQDIHHCVIPQGRWGKSVPDAIKNHVLNLKPMPAESRVLHMGIHGGGPLRGMSRAQRLWYGTNDFQKASGVSAGGRLLGIPRTD